MPVHDWMRVDAGVFHDFHQSWIITIRNALNEGLLPSDYYALAEQVTPVLIATSTSRLPPRTKKPGAAFPTAGSE